MIVHNVTVKWVEGISEDQIATITALLDGLAKLDVVDSVVRGPALKLNPATAATSDYGFSVRLPDEDAFQAYLVHPEHVALAEMLVPLTVGRMSVQLSA